MKQIGVDIDSKYLVVRVARTGELPASARFDNTEEGHRKFIRWATRDGESARVCCESTGVYGQQFALALHGAARIEVMVVNPKAVRKFAEALLRRGKTDAIDADVILEFLQRMPFKAWQPPSAAVLEIQALSRRLLQLTVERTRERNHLHAAQRRGPMGEAIAQDIAAHLSELEQRIKILRVAALRLIGTVPALQSCYERLVSASGIGPPSAIKLLGELMVLPADMQAAQWVAHAGLDPRPHESGLTHKPRRISRAGNHYLREALYMPALVAIKHDANVNAFYSKLIAAGKKPLQAIVAVMRKLLQALWGMLKNQQTWNGEKFYRLQTC